MKAAKKRPAKEVGSTEIINRLRAAREIALVCYNGAQAAFFNFPTREARKWAKTDYAKFKQHVELWFSRWEKALQDFDATIDAELWERIELAAGELGPLTIGEFPFATAHQAARQSLQWWLNLKTTWDIECKAAEDFAKKKKFPKDSPVSKLNAKELARLIKQREVERCVRLVGDDIREFKSCLMVSPSLGIDARIRQECKLAERAAEKRDRSQTDSEIKGQILQSAKLLPAGLWAKKNQLLKTVVGNRQRALQLIDELRQENVAAQ